MSPLSAALRYHSAACFKSSANWLELRGCPLPAAKASPTSTCEGASPPLALACRAGSMAGDWAKVGATTKACASNTAEIVARTRRLTAILIGTSIFDFDIFVNTSLSRDRQIQQLNEPGAIAFKIGAENERYALCQLGKY
jgi:hypothetical protein